MSREEIEALAKTTGQKVTWVPNPLYQKKKVYLAGPITGLSYDGAVDWRDYVCQKLNPSLIGYSPLRFKQYLKDEKVITSRQEDNIKHSDLSVTLSSDKGIVARDGFDVKTSDLVIMNLLGAKRVSIGTVWEAGLAYAYDVPVILVMEPEGNIHDHMMIRTIPFIVHDLDTAIQVAHAILLP